MSPRTMKQQARLASVEAELRSRLLQHLPAVAEGRGTDFFTTRDFNPHGLQVSTIGQELAELASEALTLRELLGDPSEESVSHLLRAALAESANLHNEHRLGPIRLAERLLSALRDRSASSG